MHATHSTPDLRALARFDRIEIHEDNAGGLYLRPVGQGIVLQVWASGDALTDCRLYGIDWTAEDCLPDHVHPVNGFTTGAPTHVATWWAGGRTSGGGTRPEALELTGLPLGAAAREYIEGDR